MMFSGAPHSYFCVCIVLTSLMIGVFSESEKSVAECETHLKNMFKKVNFTNVVEQLFESQLNDTGFVYSDLTLVHHLITMFALGSPPVRRSIRKYLGLDPECDNVLLCAAMDKMIQQINDRQSPEILYFFSQLYHQNNTVVKGLDACARKKEIDFTRDSQTVLTDINKEYREYCPTESGYLNKSLNPREVLYLLDAFRVTGDVYGKIKLVRSTLIPEFYDLHGSAKLVNWLQISGKWWRGCRSPQREKVPGTECPVYIKIYASERQDIHTLYFQPEFSMYEHEYEKRVACLREILLNIREYINWAITKKSVGNCVKNPNTMYANIAVPVMDLSTSYDLTTVLTKDLGPLFEENEIAGIGERRHTLHSFIGWEHMTNKPANYTELQLQTKTAFLHIYTPFVYAIVDKHSQIILKAGAFLSG